MNLLWLLAVLWTGCARPANLDAEFFLVQASADPEMRIEDAYKWLFHAARGGEHAIANEFAVRKWLDQEWAALAAPAPEEPLWTPLTADGRIGRLNLRPYKARGGSRDALHAAFLAGTQAFDADPARFRNTWRTLGHQLRQKPVSHLNWTEWQRLDREMRARDYPAIHHSPEYEQARHPAYRVLPVAEARGLLGSLSPSANLPR